MKVALREIHGAETRSAAEAAIETFAEKYGTKYARAVECLTKDRDAFAESLDKDWPGPVPYTLLIAPGGKVVYRKTGAIEPLELKRAIVGVLGRTYK